MYQGYPGNEEKWNLWWRTSAFPATSYKALGDWQVTILNLMMSVYSIFMIN